MSPNSSATFLYKTVSRYLYTECFLARTMQGSYVGQAKNKGVENEISLEELGKLVVLEEMKHLPVKFGYTMLKEEVVKCFSEIKIINKKNNNKNWWCIKMLK